MNEPLAIGLIGLFVVVVGVIASKLMPRAAIVEPAEKQDGFAAFFDALFGFFAAGIAFGAIEWVGRTLHADARWGWAIVIVVWTSLWLSWTSVRVPIATLVRRAIRGSTPMDGN